MAVQLMAQLVCAVEDLSAKRQDTVALGLQRFLGCGANRSAGARQGNILWTHRRMLEHVCAGLSGECFL
jgi:hypothetical protein